MKKTRLGGVYILEAAGGIRAMNRISPEDLSRLLGEHGPALVLYARQWCGTPEDVVQDAVLMLVRQDVPPENVVGWLYRAVRNGAISAARSAGRRSRRETAAAHRGEPWFEPSPADRLDALEATRALAELPLDQREAIVARLWGGLSLEQVAELMEISTSTVHRLYHKGLLALRERLGEPCRQKTAEKSQTQNRCRN